MEGAWRQRKGEEGRGRGTEAGEGAGKQGKGRTEGGKKGLRLRRVKGIEKGRERRNYRERDGLISRKQDEGEG